jgi:hypothetical protein
MTEDGPVRIYIQIPVGWNFCCLGLPPPLLLLAAGGQRCKAARKWDRLISEDTPSILRVPEATLQLPSYTANKFPLSP